jgi:TolB-like protein/lipoprotein NlpI
VGAAYLVVGWLLVEVGSVVFESFEAPHWVIKVFIAAIALGLPLALVFAWAFEKTPEGIKLEKNVDRSQSITHVTGKKLDRTIIAVLAVVVIVLVYREASRPEPGAVPPAGEQPTTQTSASSGSAQANEKSIAVLPFTNMSSDAEQDYFASGIHEDILTYLSRIGDLRVISRTSVLKYTGEQHDIRAIARELGVNHILEGSVRKSGSRIRVTAQLIDAVDDEHIWAENFDRDLTDVFAIQSEVAQEIVKALEASLSPQEARLLNARPTSSVLAWEMYSRAREIMSRSEYSTQKYAEAEPLTKAALEEDPQFALAHLQLADIYAQYYWRGDQSDARRESIRLQIDKAMGIAPELPEVQVALSEYYYRVMEDFEGALAVLDKVMLQLPNSADVLERRGYSLRRLGRWDESIEAFRKAWELDPSNLSIARALQGTLDGNRRWKESLAVAEQQMDRGDADPLIELNWAWTRLNYLGDLESARQVLARVPAVDDGAYWNLRVNLLWLERDLQGVLRELEDPDHVEYSRESDTSSFDALVRGLVLRILGDEPAARKSFQAAVEGFETLHREAPTGESLGPLAVSQACLGQREAALESITRARELLPESKDSIRGVNVNFFAAWVLAVLGENQRALDELKHQLQVPWGLTAWNLHQDPIWDSLREEPRFKAMVAEVAGQ